MVRRAWCVVGNGGLVGGGENLLPPFAGQLPQGLVRKPFLEIIWIHLNLINQSPLADSSYFVIERTQPLAQFV